MTKRELASKIAKQAGITKKAAASTLEAFVGAVHDTLKDKDVTVRIAGLGTFHSVKRKPRNGVNPQTQARIKIPAKRAVSFRAAKALKNAVKKAK